MGGGWGAGAGSGWRGANQRLRVASIGVSGSSPGCSRHAAGVGMQTGKGAGPPCTGHCRRGLDAFRLGPSRLRHRPRGFRNRRRPARGNHCGGADRSRERQPRRRRRPVPGPADQRRGRQPCRAGIGHWDGHDRHGEQQRVAPDPVAVADCQAQQKPQWPGVVISARCTETPPNRSTSGRPGDGIAGLVDGGGRQPYLPRRSSKGPRLWCHQPAVRRRRPRPCPAWLSA